MRRDRPPAFMISPASMKKGTASSGKLLAPSITFCARIWASNMFMCHISAAPQASRAKAMGTPRAMAPSKDPRKMAMVMGSLGDGFGVAVRHVVGFGDADQLVLLDPAGEQLPQVAEDEDEGDDGEEQARRVEIAHGRFHHRAGRARVDDGLLP